MLRPENLAAFGVTLAMSGCYMSYAEQADERGRPCREDSDCDDGLACTRDECGADRTCRHGPAPMGDLRIFPSGGFSSDAVAHEGRAMLAYGGTSIRPVTLDGPVDEWISLPAPGGDRDWDTAIASMGDDGLAQVTHMGGGLALRLIDAPESFDTLSPAGIFVDLQYTGSHLVAITDWMDTCGIGWAGRDGRWISTAIESTPNGCPFAWVPDSGTSTTGHPAARRPVGFTADGGAIFLSLDRDGTIHRLVASPGSRRVDLVPLDSPGPRYFHSLVGAAGTAGYGVIWVQTDVNDAAEQELRFAVLDEDLAVRAGPHVFPTGPGPYSFRMEVVWCEGRFVAMWNDRARGTIIAQLDENAEPLGDLVRYGEDLTSGHVNLICLPAGVVAVSHNELATLRCPAD